MYFWNGNKSPARQRYELELLQAVMDAAHYRGTIMEDRTDYPVAEDEGNIFRSGTDILVTVLGNQKFAGVDKIVINTPLARGMLGKRLLIIRKSEKAEFAPIQTESEMKRKVAGIPATWADAELFRANGYPVVEQGSLQDIFIHLAGKAFDYVSLGALEIEDVFRNLAVQAGDLYIDGHLMLQYPMPLVFYVHPESPEIAEHIRKGLQAIRGNGQFDAIFNRHFGETIERLALHERRVFHLINPLLPDL